MPTKMGSLKASDFVEQFHTACQINLTRNEWDLSTFLESVKQMSPEVFSEFLNTYKAYSLKSAEYVADYPNLLDAFSRLFDSELDPSKSPPPPDFKEIQNQHNLGIYRAKLWITILDEVLPNVVLSKSLAAKKIKEILDELFEHLPAASEIAINCFTSHSNGVDYYGTVQELLPTLKKATPAFVENATVGELLNKAERCLSALAKAHEFSIIIEESDDAQAFGDLYALVYNKAKEHTGTKQRATLRKTLDKIDHEHNQNLLALKNNPWASLFRFYHIDWIELSKPAETVDIAVEAPMLLALLDDESQDAQAKFIEQLKKGLTYFRNIPETELTPEIVHQYATLIESVHHKCHLGKLPKPAFIGNGIQALLTAIRQEIEEDSPILETLNTCHDILIDKHVEESSAPTLEVFKNWCDNLKNDYENYANATPTHWYTMAHLSLILELGSIIRIYKTLPGQLLQPATLALFGTVDFIVKKAPPHLYQTLKDELRRTLFTLIPQRPANLNHQAGTPDLSRSPTLESDVTPVLTRSPTPESDVTPVLTTSSNAESELMSALSRPPSPQSDQDATPVLTRESTPEPLDIPPEPSEREPSQPSANDPQMEILTDHINKFQVSKRNEIQSLAAQFRDVRISEKMEKEEAKRLKRETEVAKLEEKLQQLKIKQQRKLAAQQKRYEQELRKESERLKAEYAKKEAKQAKSHQKALKKQEKLFNASMQELPAKLKQEAQQRLDELRKAQEAQYKQQDEENSLRLAEYRASIESSSQLQDIKLEHEAKMAKLETSFQSAREKLPGQVEERFAAHYQGIYAAYRQNLVSQLKRYRDSAEVKCLEQFQSQMIAMHEERIKQERKIWNELKKRYEVVEQVALPKPLVDFMHQFKPNTPNLIALDGYYNTLRKLFINPDYLRQFNFVFNYGFLSSLIPTIPERYSLVISQSHPALLQFWRNELVIVNAEPKHDAQIIATFLLLPILDKEQTGTLSQHIQSCIDDFISCFESPIHADKVALTKILEAILHDQGTDSLYNRYREYEMQYKKFMETSREYLPHFNQARVDRSLPVNEPKDDLEEEQSKRPTILVSKGS